MKVMVIEIKHYHLSIKIRPYLKNINNLKKPDTWKVQLTIAISSKDNDEESVMYSKGDNIEIIVSDNPDEVIEELFQSLLSRYQI